LKQTSIGFWAKTGGGFIEKSNIRRIETILDMKASEKLQSFIEKSNIRRIETPSATTEG